MNDIIFEELISKQLNKNEKQNNSNNSSPIKIDPKLMPFIALSKKNIENSFLEKQINEKMKYISLLQQKSENYKKTIEEQKKKIENLERLINEKEKQFEKDKSREEIRHLEEISKYKKLIDSFAQLSIRANMHELDNDKLNLQLNQLKKEYDELQKKAERDVITTEVNNELKLQKLKEKVYDNINKTKDKVTEMNMKYMDVSTKLAFLQNHQLLVQLDYLTQQLDESKKTIELLEKKIFELNKDIEIHKEVEVGFAEKYKKLKEELLKQKYDENKEILSSKELSKTNTKTLTNQQQSSNVSSTISNNKNNNNDNIRILNVEKKALNLEKKLEYKKKEYNDLKEKYEHIYNFLNNRQKKYFGLYHFLDESLNLFFVDENILNNKNIYINNESLKQLDFSNLSKEEKYSTLIILMKYLMPLIYDEKVILSKDNSLIDNCKINYHFPKENKLIINDKFRKIIRKKSIQRNSSCDNIDKTYKVKGINSYETLPSIIRGQSLRKVNIKNQTAVSVISSTTVNYTSNNNC